MAVQKFLLEMATTAASLASSILYCSKCASANICLEQGGKELVCRTCFRQVELPGPLMESPLMPGWEQMQPSQKMAVLMQQAEGISARTADLAALYQRPTSGIAQRMTPSHFPADIGGGLMFGAAFQSMTAEERALAEDCEEGGGGGRKVGGEGEGGLETIVGSPNNAPEGGGWGQGAGEAEEEEHGDGGSGSLVPFHNSRRAIGVVGYHFDTPLPSSSHSEAGSRPMTAGTVVTAASQGSIAASAHEVRSGVDARHPSVVILNEGPADPRDLEASVKQFRVLVKTTEQVRYYEQLVEQMKRDQESLLARQVNKP